MSEPRSRTHRLREVLLTTGAVLGVLSILLAVAAAALGITPLVFRSGSMSPAIETGDLGIARAVSASELQVGDIVSVVNGRGERVTHRIVNLELRDDGAVLELQGDTNDVPDAELYELAEADRLLFSVPKAGYVTSWLAGSGGVFLGGLLVGAVLLVLVTRSKDAGGPRPGRRRAGSALAVGAVLLTLPAVVQAPRPVGTLAAWNDPVDVTGTPLTAYTVPAPIMTCEVSANGSQSERGVTLTWTAVTSPPTTYTVSVGTLSGATVTMTGTTTRTLSISYDPSTSANHNLTVTVAVSPELTNVPSWTGTAGTRQFTTGRKKQDPPTCVA